MPSVNLIKNEAYMQAFNLQNSADAAAAAARITRLSSEVNCCDPKSEKNGDDED